MQNKATRRSFYFSSKNVDLLDFLESREGLSANEFLIEILRAAQSNSHQATTKDMTNEELYLKLENLISNLKNESKLEKIETTSIIQESNCIPTFDSDFFDVEL